MNEADPRPDEFASPAERSLHDRLEPVRSTPPESPADLVSSVARTLRWQSILVLPMTAAVAIACGALDAVRAVLRSKPS